jgi:RND family efflux transporter MFP subunit
MAKGRTMGGPAGQDARGTRGLLRRAIRWTVGLVIAGAAVGGGLLLVGRHGGAAQAPVERPAVTVAVTLAPVTPRAVQRTVAVVGSLYGRDEIAILPKVDGRVIRIYHDVGDTIRPGEVLLELDPTDYELAAAEARRALELELAKLGLKELPGEAYDVSRLPMVVRAAAQERDAALRRDRVQRLGGVTSDEDRETAEMNWAVAKAGSQQALLDARATLAAARHRQAALDIALQKLKDTKVLVPGAAATTAPVRLAAADPADGPEYAVAQRSVSEGEMVYAAPGMATTLYRLIIDRPLKLKATVPERFRGAVKVGQEVRLAVESYPGQEFAGQVARVNPSVDRASRTFQIEVHVPNDDRKLSPGSFAKAQVLTHTGQAPTVPEEALVTFAGVTKVFVVQGEKAREVQVRTGQVVTVTDQGRPRTWIEVEGELPPGAPVITSGQTQLGDGTPVRVR